jgi:RNA polymerase sigma factor (sigma-70 family)
MSDGSINPPTRGRSVLGIAHIQEEGIDRQLLELFVARGDEAAFEALVERHGPMVFAACRRVLRDAHEAEDACQATFLVLARNAGSLRRPERLSRWLYGVAIRAARKAQRTAARYRAHARQGSAMQATDLTTEVVWRDLRPVLDGELERLPGKYRTPLVLCYLQGLSVEEAARQMGCPRGTILSRLARGRERLRSRLVRRGLTLSAGLFAVLLTQCASASTPLATAFIHSTARAACSFAARGGASAALVPRRSAEVALAVLRSMFFARLKAAGVGLLGVGVVLTGIAWGLRSGKAADHAGPGVVAADKGAPIEQPAPIKEPAPKDDKELLEGTWPGVSQVVDGKFLQFEPGKGVTLTFTGDKVKLLCTLFDAWNKDFEFRLNSQARPKTIDLISTDPATKGRVELVGIYELNGDTFKMCFSVVENGRPTEFVGKGNQFIWVFKREPVNQAKELPKKP